MLISAVFSPQTDSVSGLQFDLQYDSAAMSVVATAGDSARASSKNIFYSDLAPDRKRFVAVGLNQTLIPGGSLLKLFINFNANASSGPHALTFSNAKCTGPSGQTVPLEAIGASVTVEGDTGSRLQPEGVLNAASFSSGPVSPGEIVTLIGAGIGPLAAAQPASSGGASDLGGTSVLFDGRPAPLLYGGLNQINAVVPYGIAGQTTTEIVVTRNGELVAGFPLPVSSATPAIFTLGLGGVGPGAILNEDSTLNSPVNPAARGSVVVLFATGAGPMEPVTDGQIVSDPLPHPSSAVSVRIGGAAADVLYAGGAPGLIAGVLQVNCRVPQDTDPGSKEVNLTVGTATSPAGVTVAVR